ncbi:MAG: hypothetical protein HQK56_03800 [Deltaproteobacteria bacterium]|nr:hypothetical protein [Deltaproteobacteria bacterium]
MHFTYDKPEAPDLNQGDLLKRSPQFEEILNEYFPNYFNQDDCKYFIIITQSCDLVRRDNSPCRASYITLAPVRPLSVALEQEKSKYQRNKIEKKLGFANASGRTKLEQFMERLFNNNERDYFFLFREPELGLTDDSCALLQLPISIRAGDHYEILLAARILQLKESFQHKLGYSVGTLYSRVGTDDWVPKYYSAPDFKKLTEEPVNKSDFVLWLDSPIHRRVLKELEKIPFDDLSPELLEKSIKKNKKTGSR